MLPLERPPRFRFFIPTLALLKFTSALKPDSLERGTGADRFARATENYFGSKNCQLYSSFRMGLYFVLQALELKAGDEVLMTPITIPDAVNAIHIQGLKPVFVDMSLDDHNIDCRDLERKITPRSRVLLVTHLSGIVPDMDRIREIANRHGLILIEDFSQNYGATWRGRKLGTIGRIGIGSLSKGKTICSMSGGIVLSDDDEFCRKLTAVTSSQLGRPDPKALRYYLIYCLKINLATSRLVFSYATYYALRFLAWLRPQAFFEIHAEKQTTKDIFYDNIPIIRDRFPEKFFSWFSDFQASLGEFTLRSCDAGNKRRRHLARLLYEGLSEKARAALPKALLDFENNTFYHFPINCGGQKERMTIELLRLGVDAAGYGLNLCSKEPVFSRYHVRTPVAQQIKDDVIFLPLHETFPDKLVVRIAEAVNRYYA